MDERYVSSFDALVSQLCDELVEVGRVQRSLPYVLFGHSMGALLAYGITQRLRTLGQPLPRHLFASGSAAPSCRNSLRFQHKRTDEELIADLRTHGGTSEAVLESPELLRITLDTLSADYRVCASYVHQETPALPVPVYACGGRDDDIAANDLLAWSEETSAGFSLEWFAGGHFFIRQDERSLMRSLTQVLVDLTEPGFAHGVA